MADIYINYGADAEQMAYEILQKANISSRIKTIMKVVIKPNLVVSRPASEGATTHPELVEGVVRYLKDCGVQNITIAEGAWVGDSTISAFQKCGYQKLAKRYGVKLIDTKNDGVQAHFYQGQNLQICSTVAEADYLINMPVLKGHCQTGMTCCLKNLKGCIPDSEKRRFHTAGLHQPIAALAGAIRPDLHLVDSICGDLTFEEGGNPVESNRILLGFDPVLLDSYGAHLMGYQPEEIKHLNLAREYGIGHFYDDNTVVDELNAQNRPKVGPTHSRIVKKLAEYIDEDGACSACYAALIFALNNTGITGGHKGKVKIGQGFRDKKSEGLGVGNCTAGCRQYVTGCPPKASDIAKHLQAWNI